MKRESIQLILIIFLFMLGMAVTQADAAVITVNNSEGGNYTSIQEAVNNAQNGDTILVSSGVYRENVNVSKELTILSHSVLSGSQNNRIYVIGNVPDNAVFNISSNNVTVNGFHIIRSPSGTNKYKEVGIYLEGVRNCSLSNNTVLLNDLGIVLKNSQYNHLNGNLVGLGNEGIALDKAEENILSNNLAVKNSQGILLTDSVNNTLINNTAGSNAIGISLHISQRNKLAYNLILKNEYGIRVRKATSNSLIDNRLYLNGIGVYLTDSSNNSLYKNEFVSIVNAVDEGNNLWNSSSAGNFWNNYTGTDADGNGIIDTPYVINQTAEVMDYMPLVNRISSGNISEILNASGNVLPLLFDETHPASARRNPEKGIVVETIELEQINISLEEGPVFLKLGAEWCGACQSMEPVLDELAAEYGDKTTIMSVNINKNPQLATYFNVGYIPDSSVIVGIENGKYVYMQEDGNVTTDKVRARIVGLEDKEVFKRLLERAIDYEEKSKSG